MRSERGLDPPDETGRRSVVARAREVLELAKERIRDEVEARLRSCLREASP